MTYFSNMFGWLPSSLYSYLLLAVAVFAVALLFKVIKLILDAIPFV